MVSIIQYRLTEEGTQSGAKVKTYEVSDATVIPTIGSIVNLFPTSTGYGKVIVVEDVVRAEPPGSAKKRFITLTLERV